MGREAAGGQGSKWGAAASSAPHQNPREDVVMGSGLLSAPFQASSPKPRQRGKVVI